MNPIATLASVIVPTRETMALFSGGSAASPMLAAAGGPIAAAPGAGDLLSVLGQLIVWVLFAVGVGVLARRANRA